MLSKHPHSFWEEDPFVEEYSKALDRPDQKAWAPLKINYTDELLYGPGGRPHWEFQTAIRTLATSADQIVLMNPLEIEYPHRMTLFWAEVGGMKRYLGVSVVISEIVSELQTARFQMLRKDTPITFIRAIARGLEFVTKPNNLDSVMVDQMVQAFEAGGFDSLAPEALRKSDG